MEKQCGTLKGAVAMYERRMQMLENVLRKERGYPPVELPELPGAPIPPPPPAATSTATAPSLHPPDNTPNSIPPLHVCPAAMV